MVKMSISNQLYQLQQGKFIYTVHILFHLLWHPLTGVYLKGVLETPSEILTCRLAAGTPHYLSLAAQIFRINETGHSSIALWYNKKHTLIKVGTSIKNQNILIEQSDLEQ